MSISHTCRLLRAVARKGWGTVTEVHEAADMTGDVETTRRHLKALARGGILKARDRVRSGVGAPTAMEFAVRSQWGAL